MRVRVLTAWPGSPPCGAVGEVDDAVALVQLARGNAERIGAAPETAAVTPGERAMKPKGKPRR